MNKKIIMVAAAICVFLGSSSLAVPQTADARCFRGVLRRVFVPAKRVVRRVKSVGSCVSSQVASDIVISEQQGSPIRPLVGRPLRVLRCASGTCN
jgi:hypothetical protein